MFGISGTSLGMVLRAKRYDYTDMSKVASVYALIVLVITAVISLLSRNIDVSDLALWIPENMFALNIVWVFIGSFLVGLGAFISMFIGGLVFDASKKIIEG